MADGKTELVRNAIMDKLGLGIAVYSSDDILTVAGISKEEVDKIASQLQNNVDALSRPSPPISLLPKKQKST